MKKLFAILTVLSMLSIFPLWEAQACEPVKTPGNIALEQNLSTATVTIGGEAHTFAGNSVSYPGYQEWNKTKLISEHYEEVSFYLQLAASSELDEGTVRVIRNKFKDGDMSQNILQQQDIFTVKRGEDAQFITLPFGNFEQLYVIFNTKGCTYILADLNFINYEAKAPSAKVLETDVATVGEKVVSTALIEFSQKMKTDVSPAEFTLNGAENSVQSVEFDETGKIATLTFAELVEFNQSYTVEMSENVRNDCDNCDFAVSEEYRALEVTFAEPTDIVIGAGAFVSGGTEISDIVSGKIGYKVPVRNKYDLTEGGREFTLILMMYVNGVLKQVKYDNCLLLPGQKQDLSAEVNVADVENTEIEAFLWDNPINMNALDDMHSLRKQEA